MQRSLALGCICMKVTFASHGKAQVPCADRADNCKQLKRQNGKKCSLKEKSQCPATCGVCNSACHDQKGVTIDEITSDKNDVASCGRLKSFCTGIHAKKVKQSCPMTCGMCSAECEDMLNTGIKLGKATGSCSQLKLYCAHKTHGPEIQSRCPVTCGVCTPEKASIIARRTGGSGSGRGDTQQRFGLGCLLNAAKSVRQRQRPRPARTPLQLPRYQHISQQSSKACRRAQLVLQLGQHRRRWMAELQQLRHPRHRKRQRQHTIVPLVRACLRRMHARLL